jgi:hypothetical protein
LITAVQSEVKAGEISREANLLTIKLGFEEALQTLQRQL